MNSLFTEEPNLINLIQFQRHESFEKEIKKLSRKHRYLNDGIMKLSKLLEIQFHPQRPKTIISPKILHHIRECNNFNLWKVECAIPKSGLRAGQNPRIYFAHHGNIIYFLCLDTHSNNYEDSELRSKAFERVSDFLS